MKMATPLDDDRDVVAVERDALHQVVRDGAVRHDSDAVRLRLITEPQEDHRRHRDIETEHRDQLGDLRGAAEMTEQEAVENQPDKRGHHEDREHEREAEREPVRDMDVVEDGGREKCLRPEREVEDAGRPVREHQSDREERVHAAEAGAA